MTKKKFFLISIIFSLILFISLSFSEPGGVEDPLVSKSYVDEKISQLVFLMGQGQGQAITQEADGAWVVVEVEPGGFLELMGGAELILRSGEATAVPSVKEGIINGLSDLTDGLDLVANQPIKKNHHIIVPRSDGRGARCYNKCFFLVKGAYMIK